MPQPTNLPLQKLSQTNGQLKPNTKAGIKEAPEGKKVEVPTANLISLTYTFIFSKEANLWDNIANFEKDLADFFAANSLEAEPIATISGSNGGRMMFIKKIELGQTLQNSKGANLQMLPTQKQAQKTSFMVQTMLKKINKGGK